MMNMLGGGTDFSLRIKAKEDWLGQETLQSAIDSLAAHLAILNEHGTIIAVNSAWRTFAADNGFTDPDCGIGANYISICESANSLTAPEAMVVAQAIREILAVRRRSVQLQYAGHSPWEERWFKVRITGFNCKGAIGAIVAHENVTDQRRAQAALQQAKDEVERQVARRTEELSKANIFLREQMTERQRAQDRINYLAYHDSLTQLPNRMLFTDRVMQAINTARHNQDSLVIMRFWLDRFKSITDTLGLAAGDRLLQEVAGRLKGMVDELDTVAYLGGSEFAVLLTRVENSNKVVEEAGRFLDAFEAPFMVDEHQLYSSVSIGISLFPEDGQEAQGLLKNASAALERAIEQSGSNFQFYTASMNARAAKLLTIETNLRQAITRSEFILNYQPQLDLKSGQIVGTEALVRWSHPEYGMISPGEFIPVAESTGLIVPIGEWVLRTACLQAKKWQDEGLAALRIAVNLSAHQFQKSNLIEVVAETLRETRLAPECLELELTESAVMKNAEAAIATLHQLKDMGLKISIDDFGTGYSSLNYLRRFPLDVLKIDQSFMRNATSDANSHAIVRAIVTLAHSLNLHVIAEGVETEEQLSLLRDLGCDEMQGYLFSKPLPADSFRELLLKGLLTGWTQPMPGKVMVPGR